LLPLQRLGDVSRAHACANVERTVIEKILCHLILGPQQQSPGRVREPGQLRYLSQRRRRQFQAVLDGIYRLPMRQSGFPQAV